LQVEIETSDKAHHSARTAAADQSRGWNNTAETDTPQVEARQSYRNRERESADAFSDSSKTRHGKPVTDSRDRQ
jgi:hypothetical protein